MGGGSQSISFSSLPFPFLNFLPFFFPLFHSALLFPTFPFHFPFPPLLSPYAPNQLNEDRRHAIHTVFVVTVASSCEGDQFHCANTSRCIDAERICDFHDDCGDNSDEQSCGE